MKINFQFDSYIFRNRCFAGALHLLMSQTKFMLFFNLKRSIEQYLVVLMKILYTFIEIALSA